VRHLRDRAGPMLVTRPHLGYIAASLDKSSRPTDLRAQLQSALATPCTGDSVRLPSSSQPS